MGCRFSLYRSAAAINGVVVRVVYINGYVEDFPGPITVAEVTGKPPNLVCFSRTQLLSPASRPLGLDEQLQPGRIYFLLPYSVVQTESSPVDLATLVTRLTAYARKPGSVAVSPMNSVSKLSFLDSGEAKSVDSAGSVRCDYDRMLRQGTSSKLQTWKPLLDTIEESYRRSTTDEWSVERSTRGMSCRSDGTYSRLVEEEEKQSS